MIAKQLFVFGLFAVAAIGSSLARPAAAQMLRAEIIPETLAQRHGLTRPWVTRVRLDPGRGKLIELTLHEGLLISVTDASSIQTFDAETGRTVWVTQVGRRNLVNTPVGASPKYVAVCNGQTLYMLSRADGKILFSRKMQGTPAAAPTLDDSRVYVATFQGAIESYSINVEKPDLEPTTYRTGALIEEPPVLAGVNIVWATEKGFVYSAKRDNLEAHFRFKTRGAITAGMSARPPLIYTASGDGYVYAIDENTGESRWQFSTGFPVRETPVVLGNDIYPLPDLNGMYCLSADKGVERWHSRNVAHFVSASATRLYASDASGHLLVVDRRSGAHLDMLPTQLLPIKVFNIQTDRIYLATTTGLVQCLREVDQVKPLVHVQPVTTEEGAAPPAAAAADAAADEGAPAAAPAAAAAGDDPFGAPPP